MTARVPKASCDRRARAGNTVFYGLSARPPKIMQSVGWKISFCGFLRGHKFQKLSVPLGAHLLGVKKLDFPEVGTQRLVKIKTADNP